MRIWTTDHSCRVVLRVLTQLSIVGFMLCIIPMCRRKAAAAAAAATAAQRGEGGTVMQEHPEFMLPYALHLLAHHPDFPTPQVCCFNTEGEQRMAAAWTSMLCCCEYEPPLGPRLLMVWRRRRQEAQVDEDMLPLHVLVLYRTACVTLHWFVVCVAGRRQEAWEDTEGLAPSVSSLLPCNRSPMVDTHERRLQWWMAGGSGDEKLSARPLCPQFIMQTSRPRAHEEGADDEC